jgi:hypothetical protein
VRVVTDVMAIQLYRILPLRNIEVSEWLPFLNCRSAIFALCVSQIRSGIGMSISSAFAQRLILLSTFVVCGCSSTEEPVAVPSFDANSIWSQALASLDKDGDKLLSEEEIEASPSLTAAMPTTDKDGDKQISDTELKQRVEEYRDDYLALMPFACLVVQDGYPVVDATVRLVPASFMSDSIKPAIGKTDSEGFTVLAINGMEIPGVQVGMYRVEISKRDDGEEAIAAQFNSETKLGQEVASDVEGIERDVVFELNE